jgi:hypothetical protein
LGEKADDLLDKDEDEAWDGLLLNGDRPSLKILQARAMQNQAKAVAFRPSWARTSLSGTHHVTSYSKNPMLIYI